MSFLRCKEKNMSIKIDKINKEIEKAEQTITQYQGRLRALHKEKMDTENLEMIDFLKKNKVNYNDLQTMVGFFQEESGTVVPITTNTKEVKEIEKT